MTISRKQIAVGLLLAAALLVVVGLIVRATSANAQYNYLEKAVVSHQLASVVGEPKRGSSDCYPSGEAKSCPALIYTLNNDACAEAANVLQQDSKGCSTVKTTRDHENKELSYLLSSGDTKTLIVYVSE
jgi:hypothetical protein